LNSFQKFPFDGLGNAWQPIAINIILKTVNKNLPQVERSKHEFLKTTAKTNLKIDDFQTR
jgi:hypothetical protein